MSFSRETLTNSRPNCEQETKRSKIFPEKMEIPLYTVIKHQLSMDVANATPGYYLGFIDGMNIFLFLATTMTYGFFIVIPQYWLQLWTESGAASTSFYVGGFLFLSTMSWAMTSAQMW
ncbi:hypothetical protein RJ55_07695 [Drechmeria coniospora]|nr:hypothetical protein RJ55_07695 [Drechmeria coniospora]